jgi:hypothetical protein
MKKEDVVDVISWIILDDGTNKEKALHILSYLEGVGMLPPICTTTIKDGKHTPTERKWDDEEN